MNAMVNVRYVVIAVLVAFAAGFFLGRGTVETKEIVQYVQGETVTGSVDVSGFRLDEVKETKTDVSGLPRYLWITDTVWIDRVEYVHEKIDTLKIVEEFMLLREYDFTVFDNENGRLNVRPSVQYNALQSFGYTFTPMQKVITRTREKTFVPFASASYSTLDVMGAGGGVFIKNVGLEYQFQYNHLTDKTGHSFGLKVKF